MSRTSRPNKMLDAAVPLTIVSSTNTGPIEVSTFTPHNYSTGQKVTIVGHEVNTAANGTWTITVTGASSFELDGSEGNGVGGGTGIVAPKASVLQVADLRDITLAFDAGDTAALTLKVVASIQTLPPDFAKPSSADNQWDTMQMISLSGAETIDGDDGLVLASEAISKMYEININGVNWLSVIIEDGTEGPITVMARQFGDI